MPATDKCVSLSPMHSSSKGRWSWWSSDNTAAIQCSAAWQATGFLYSLMEINVGTLPKVTHQILFYTSFQGQVFKHVFQYCHSRREKQQRLSTDIDFVLTNVQKKLTRASTINIKHDGSPVPFGPLLQSAKPPALFWQKEVSFFLHTIPTGIELHLNQSDEYCLGNSISATQLSQQNWAMTLIHFTAPGHGGAEVYHHLKSSKIQRECPLTLNTFHRCSI